jgi:predicted ATP-grasp superfamily ATP-dependent carboligase
MLLRRGVQIAGSYPSAPARPAPPSADRVDVAVLDADERQSLVCARSLGRAGLRVGVFGSARWSPSFGSRWARVAGRVPHPSDPDGFVRAVRRVVDAHRPRVVVTAHDGTIDVLRRQRAQLAVDTVLALAPEAALDVALDKGRTLEVARSLGIPVPRTVVVESLDDLEAAVAEIGLPLVAKAARSWMPAFGERLTAGVAVDLAEARAFADHALAGGGSLVVQELLSGRREAVSLLIADGVVRARFAQVAHRMYPLLGGSSVVRESIALPSDLTEAADALASAARLDGYAEVEFRRDAAGRPRLMEINPRLSASVEVAVRAGVDFPRLLYGWAATGAAPAVGRYRVGVRMRWLGGDIRWLRDALTSRGRPEAPPARRAVADFVVDSLRPAAYDYVSLSDPRPVARAATGFVAKAIERRGGRRACAGAS